jgi:dihydropteroate synthase
MSIPLDLFDRRTWPDRPLIMGIVNVTPDSFSDGGSHQRWDRAVSHALGLVADGADLLDIGGESTRPGAAPVPVQEELDRVLPVIRVVRGETGVPLSIDTRKPEVAAAALEAGATLVNDVSALAGPGMAELVAARRAGVCLMHMRGEPGTMQDDPRYENVVEEVRNFLAERIQAALDAGVAVDRIWIDPGIGFGKTIEHNLELLAGLDRLGSLGYPVLVGVSRKGFIGQISDDPVHARLGGSLAALLPVLQLLHAIVRVHDVRATRQFLLVARRIAACHDESRPTTASSGG